MNGKVIEGKYAGANVNKVPDKNLLFIQTEDGNKIPLSKSNDISIDDITDQYVSNARKTIMVLWNDFETSIIQLGIYEHATTVPPEEKISNTEKLAGLVLKVSKWLGICFLAMLTVDVISFIVYLILK